MKFHNIDVPPGLRRSTLKRVPARHRYDAIQEAWLAHIAGTDVNAAVWRYVKRHQRLEARETCFSQIEIEVLQRIYRCQTRIVGHNS